MQSRPGELRVRLYAIVVVMITAGVCSPNVARADIADREALPKYECHALREGDGHAIEIPRRAEIKATREMSAADAIDKLQGYLADARWRRYEKGVLYYELAWRYVDIGDVDAARHAIFEVLSNAYMEGAKIDVARGLLAQLAADEEDWGGVIAALAPVVEKQCRFIATELVESLAAAYVKQARWAEALAVLNVKPHSLSVPWRRVALMIDCDLNGVEACVNRTVAYAQEQTISSEFAEVINAELARLYKNTEGRELLAAAEQRGQLPKGGQVRPREPAIVDKLEVIEPVRPIYPRDALRSAQSGYVMLQLTVGTNGEVLEAYVVDASPPKIFDEASLKAARQVKYKPKMLDGVPVVTTGRYRIQYEIR